MVGNSQLSWRLSRFLTQDLDKNHEMIDGLLLNNRAFPLRWLGKWGPSNDPMIIPFKCSALGTPYLQANVGVSEPADDRCTGRFRLSIVIGSPLVQHSQLHTNYIHTYISRSENNFLSSDGCTEYTAHERFLLSSVVARG